MRYRSALLAVAVSLGGLLPLAAGAQPPDLSAPQREAMKKLAHWVGEWEGSGWAIRGPGSKSEFTVNESVQPKVGGLVLLVQGKGTSKDPATGEQIVGHDALGLVSYDAKAGKYTFRHYTMQGAQGEDELVLTEKGMIWELSSMPAPMRVRFTIEITGDTWVEYGEVTRDGTEWMRTMEMKLQRAKDKAAKS